MTKNQQIRILTALALLGSTTVAFAGDKQPADEEMHRGAQKLGAAPKKIEKGYKAAVHGVKEVFKGVKEDAKEGYDAENQK